MEKKPRVTVAEFRMGGPKRDEKPEDDMADEDMGSEAKASAVRDLFAAMKGNDVQAGVAAMDAWNEACGYGAEEEAEVGNGK
jgi:hypothetical protein